MVLKIFSSVFILSLWFTNIFADNLSLAIQQPTDQQTLWQNAGEVTVVVTPSTELPAKTMVQLWLDHKPYGAPQHETTFNLTGIPRGAHQLQIQLLDQQGNILLSSPTITFYLQQTRVKHGH